jgi:uncharacterized protein YbjT (DUF2867 family)
MTVLVTGATGHVGRQVVAQLGGEVRALVRDPDRARLPKRIEAAKGDLTDPSTLDKALTGVESVFLLWPFFTADRAAEAVQVIASRARRVVYLSAMSVRDEDQRGSGFWGEVEYLIERSGLEWTFLRAGGFATNTLVWADQIRTAGVVRWPYGQAARSLIHERDIAAVAVRALTGDGHAGAKYVLTGPDAVTQAEQVRIIGEAIGRPLRWVEPAPPEAREQVLAALGDPAFVDGALAYWASLVTEPEPVTHAVQEVTGTPAHTFREWAIDHTADFS